MVGLVMVVPSPSTEPGTGYVTRDYAALWTAAENKSFGGPGGKTLLIFIYYHRTVDERYFAGPCIYHPSSENSIDVLHIEKSYLGERKFQVSGHESKGRPGHHRGSFDSKRADIFRIRKLFGFLISF
jgi:hypothetical protein